MHKYPSIVQALSTWTHISYKIIEDQIQFLEPLSWKHCQGSRCCSSTNSITSNRSLVGLSVSALSIHHSALWQRKPLLSQSGDVPQTACRFMKFSSPKTQNKIPGNTTYLCTEIPHDSASFHCYDRSQLNSNGGKWITAKRKAQKGWDVLFRPRWCLAAKLETNFKHHKPCHFGTCGKVHVRCEAKT